MSIDIYLDIPDVEGESRDAEKAGSIELQSWSWGHAVGYEMDRGTRTGRVNVDQIFFTKDMDKSSATLLKRMTSNMQVFGEATLTVRKPKPDGGHFEYVKIVLTNVTITSLTHSVSTGSEKVMESGSLGFTKYALTYEPEKLEGGPEGGAVENEYDLVAHE